MKKVLFILSAGAVCFLVSCSSKDSGGKMSDEAQKNLDATQIVNKAFETGNTGSIDSAVASDFVGHSDKGDMNRDSLKAMITMMHATNKDMKMEVIRKLADNDYVMEWMHFTGTSDGSMGMPAGPYDVHAIEVEKFKDGKAIEHWEYMDPKEMMKMMPPPPVNSMDKKTGN
jgi:predicted SnoaL-like aldol condensation-catalyzing enzyme